ncbi:MAG: DUF2163 domain-containing protein [Pseudomonadota bacterium]
MSLSDHLASGTTTVCRAWAVTRRDGVVLGFTDHDHAFSFEGITFAASSGLTARAVEQTTGLAVDNSEAVGALSDASIREDDLCAGAFDGAEVQSWLVNWQDVSERSLVFRGALGEVERQGNGFRAELRGLAEAINQSQGRVYQRPCSAVLGDALCRVDLAAPGHSIEVTVLDTSGDAEFVIPRQTGVPDKWFQHGQVVVLNGAAAGQVGVIKRDRERDAGRIIEVWERFSGGPQAGDEIRVVAGCDKRVETCREKFGNLLNFRGFPSIPGEDWLVSYPVSAGNNDGGSLGG